MFIIIRNQTSKIYLISPSDISWSCSFAFIIIRWQLLKCCILIFNLIFFFNFIHVELIIRNQTSQNTFKKFYWTFLDFNFIHVRLIIRSQTFILFKTFLHLLNFTYVRIKIRNQIYYALIF